MDASSGTNTTWESSPQFQQQGDVNAILIEGDYVYVGGDFRCSSGPSVYDDLCRFHLATGQLDSTWHPQPAINNFGITAIVRTNDHIFIGGDFDVISGQNRLGVAAYDLDGNLAPFDQNSSSFEVLTLFPDGDKIWVGGNSYLLGGQTRYRIAQIDIATSTATCWNAAPISNAWSTVQAIHVSGDTVHAGPFGAPAMAVLVGGPLPETPATISGPAAVAPAEVATYSIPNVPGLTYTWSITGGTGASTTNSIEVTWGAGPSGTVEVVANNPGQSNCSSNPVVLPVIISGNISVQEAAADRGPAFSLFPNPSTGMVTLRQAYSAPVGRAEVRVMDALGNLVLVSTMQGAVDQLDLSQLPNGLYFVLLVTDAGSQARRLIKQ